MRAFFLLLSAFLLALAWLLPFHKTPWTTFGSELLSFFAAVSALGAFIQTPLKVAKAQWWSALIVLIPMLQWAFGQILYLGNAIVVTGYLSLFWLMTVLGYNLALHPAERELLFKRFCMLLLGTGVISSLIAILQALDLASLFSPYMMILKGNRPYANFAQPNNFATFLSLCLVACLYLYEKRHLALRWLVPLSLLFLFCIVLTQSRTSWVVALFFVGYLSIKQYGHAKRLSWPLLMLWFSTFVAMLFVLPMVTQWLASQSDQDLVATVSVVERASSGYLRLDMWSQILVAIQQQPWFGYGWNQTGMAQIAAFELYPTHEWYKSAHNLVLDLIVWNGIPIAIAILLYYICWLYWLNKGVKDSLSICATLMVCAILIHGMLEYPVHYAYFLFPMGFLLGIIQAQYPNLKQVEMPVAVTRGLLIVGFILTCVIYRDYDFYRQQPLELSTQSFEPAYQKPWTQQVWLLTQFNERLKWLNLEPYSQMSDEQLAHFSRLVAYSASSYDIRKYATLLAYNGKIQEAEQQLWLLRELHRREFTVSDLLPQAASSSAED